MGNVGRIQEHKTPWKKDVMCKRHATNVFSEDDDVKTHVKKTCIIAD